MTQLFSYLHDIFLAGFVIGLFVADVVVSCCAEGAVVCSCLNRLVYKIKRWAVLCDNL